MPRPRLAAACSGLNVAETKSCLHWACSWEGLDLAFTAQSAFGFVRACAATILASGRPCILQAGGAKLASHTSRGGSVLFRSVLCGTWKLSLARPLITYQLLL